MHNEHHSGGYRLEFPTEQRVKKRFSWEFILQSPYVSFRLSKKPLSRKTLLKRKHRTEKEGKYSRLTTLVDFELPGAYRSTIYLDGIPLYSLRALQLFHTAVWYLKTLPMQHEHRSVCIFNNVQSISRSGCLE